MRGMSVWVGYQTRHHERAARTAGETKFLLCKMLRLALMASPASRTAAAARHLFRLVVAVIAMLFLGRAAAARLLPRFLYGQATTLVMVLFLGSVQPIFLGIIGEYSGASTTR